MGKLGNKMAGWFGTLGGIYFITVCWFVLFPNIHSDFWKGFWCLIFIILTLFSLMMSVMAFYYGVLGRED